MKLDAASEAGAGTVREARWSPNRVDVEVALSKPATVLFNQNWNEHWKSTRGEIVKWGEKWPADRDGGRLAVAAPAGRYTLSVYYRPGTFVVGAFISGVALPVLLGLFAILRRKDRAIT